MGHSYTGHNYIRTRRCTAASIKYEYTPAITIHSVTMKAIIYGPQLYTGHNHIGQNHTDHNYVGHNYIETGRCTAAWIKREYAPAITIHVMTI